MGDCKSNVCLQELARRVARASQAGRGRTFQCSISYAAAFCARRNEKIGRWNRRTGQARLARKLIGSTTDIVIGLDVFHQAQTAGWRQPCWTPVGMSSLNEPYRSRLRPLKRSRAILAPSSMHRRVGHLVPVCHPVDVEQAANASNRPEPDLGDQAPTGSIAAFQRC
jgi:hypothetical protein